MFYGGYFSAQTFAYKHVPPYWTEVSEWVSEWVEFNAPLDTIQVISEAEILNRNEPVRELGSLWSQTESQTRLRFTELDESKSLRFQTKPNLTKPNRDRSESRL